MAQNRNHATNATRPVYRTNGAAAYDINRYQSMENGSAARELREPKRHVRPRPRPKAKLQIAPLSVVGLLAAAMMLVFVICSYVQLFEASATVSELRAQLSEAQEYQQRLQSTLTDKIDLDVIQQKATELGMTMPNSKQTVYLSLQGSDRAVITGAGQENAAAAAWNTITRSVRALVEYFG